MSEEATEVTGFTYLRGFLTSQFEKCPFQRKTSLHMMETAVQKMMLLARKTGRYALIFRSLIPAIYVI